MQSKLETKRIIIYLAISFGIAWVTGLVLALTGGLKNSPVLVSGTNITLALVLLATLYMWAPALGNILTRLVTREGKKDLLIRPRFKHGWLFWLAGWVTPAIMTLVGAVIFFMLYPQYFDPTLTALSKFIAQSNLSLPFGPWGLVAIQTAVGILISPLVNGIATFGEEFGWRGYLLPKLMPLGGRKAVLLLGVIWGVWHAPVIAMGHNYGTDYPGFPWLGILAMVWFTILCGTFLAWITLRGGSVWPAVIGHAAINGITGMALVVTIGQPNPILGPLPVGIIASAGWAVLALILFLSPKALAPMGLPSQTEPIATPSVATES